MPFFVQLANLRRTLNARAAKLQISSIDYQAIERLSRAVNLAADKLCSRRGALWEGGHSSPGK
jgi:hypothetical protein